MATHITETKIKCLKQRVEDYLDNIDYGIKCVTPADVIYGVGKLIILNLNKAKDKESFEEYSREGLPKSLIESLIKPTNEMLKEFYEFGSSNNHASKLNEFKIWVHEKTSPRSYS